jgi:cyclopropane fatty-acyl-phospholipid synthase-like methyltransferase
MDQNKISYNKIADQWAAIRDRAVPSQLVVDFAASIKPNGNVLDIGCGTGYPITTFLAESGFTVTGIDIPEHLLQKAIERNFPNTTLHLCDFFDFDPSERYDGIIAFDSFFHFPKDKQAEIYSRVANWMNIGGYLLFTHGNKEGEISGEMFGETFYYSCLDTQTVHELLLDSGFEIVLSLENYTEKEMERDLVVLARKIK